MSLDIISFLESNFDKVIPVSSKEGEYKVSPCPHCGNRKNKLYINVEERVFHCFRCGFDGRIEKLFEEVGTDIHDYIIDDGTPANISVKKDTPQPQEKKAKELPEEYRELIGNNSAKAIQALQYLRNRGLNDSLISEYKIGYCFSGKYNNRIIIPYYENNELVYFVGRDFLDVQKPKYLNAEWEKMHFLFNYERVKKSSRDFIIVVEGAMDIFSAPNHTVCLLGKFVSAEQKKLLSKYRKIYVALDSDAILDSHKLIESISSNYNGELYVVYFPEGEDPSSLGNRVWDYLRVAKRIIPDTAGSTDLYKLLLENVKNTHLINTP